jgi:hypothetical protein
VRSLALSNSVFLKNSALAANSFAASSSRRLRSASACSAKKSFSWFLNDNGCHCLRWRKLCDQPNPALGFAPVSLVEASASASCASEAGKHA